MSEKETFIGIDVSKKSLDIMVLPGALSWSIENSEAGIPSLVNRIAELSPTLIVLEATGGLETLVATALSVALLPLACVNC